jgi:opacity protein-like surface antigen
MNSSKGGHLRGALRYMLLSAAVIAPVCVRAEPIGAPPPFFAAPPAEPGEPSPWSGFYVGSETFVVSGKGAKGGLGGGAVIGYDRAFADNVVLGFTARAGYAPAFFPLRPFSGFDYLSANMRLSYEMGRWTPFVTAGVALAKPDTVGRGYVSAGDSFNGLFDQSAGVRGAGAVGAGVDYAVTDRLNVGVEVSAGGGRGYWLP